eukprot:Tamp_07182.p1 GENE.Tamp_07182~~Tamp_07182.p1  ORF type:complete len:780 (-),score=165.22 Tamp_07182:49-2388(-)
MAEDAAARASQRGRPSFTTSSRNLHGASSRSAQQKQEELARRVQESRKALGSRSEGILRKSEMDSQSILRRVQSVSQGDEEQQERAAVRIQARARGNAARKHTHSASQGDEERQERAAVRIQARARGNAARKHTHSASQGDEELSRQRVPSPPAHKAGPAQWVDGIGWVQEAELEVLRDYVQQSAASVQNTSKTSAGDRPSETEPRVGSRQVFCPKTGVLLCEVHYDEHLAPSPAPSPSYSARYGSALPECESISDSIRAWQEHTSLQGGAERGGTQAEALEHRNGEGQQSRLDSAVLTDQGAGPHEVISQFVTSTEAMTVFAHDAADASKYISRGLLKSDSSSCKVCLKKKQGHHGPEFYCVAEADWKCQHCGRVKREHHGVKVYCIHEAEQTCKICAKTRRLHTGAGQYCPYDRVAADAFLRDLPALQQRRSVSVVVEGMRDNVAHRRVQEQACAVLLQLTPGVEGAEWRRIREAAGAEMQDLVAEYKKLADCGVIRAVLQAMEAHAQSAAVAQTGCRILRVLARSDAKEKIAALLGLEAIVQAMGAHREHAGVQEAACAALFSLAANNGANQEKVAALSGIEALVQAMGAHREHADVQEQACRALWSLAYNNDAIGKRIASLGAIEVIVQAMGAHREHAGVQEKACGALRNLAANNNAIKTKIKQAGGEEKVKRAVAAPNATARTKEWGQRLLVDSSEVESSFVVRSGSCRYCQIKKVFGAPNTLANTCVYNGANWGSCCKCARDRHGWTGYNQNACRHCRESVREEKEDRLRVVA